ncbi:hypothetical protein QDA02_gp14 [Microbacterium phage Margaery]|uniref:Uncharacterized protein n=1 Tax=Microbacterium phage Margaery TaxID=2591217 RepID=A0A514DHQ8_9CAUD|nr:hypothetical protein QDA02_gp14 [Microbacterium phage Margaery]QDH93151.1 hypothetical protein PBI_MARGAERY_94 [Microbacterium phage Margaery]
MRWVGPKHYRKGRLEIGRLWIAWAGWRRRPTFNVGSTRIVPVGPLAVFVHRKDDR